MNGDSSFVDGRGGIGLSQLQASSMARAPVLTNPAKRWCLAAVTSRKGPSHVLGGLSWWQSTPFKLTATGLLWESESPLLPLCRVTAGWSLGRWQAREDC
ncbi:hypothetical protein TorRG33x02_067480 [Trema orientale]|uniref:Uncharacterized protein n=1 Tax=Trema orientale TaxID=63057 RepID=A0A2P5FIF1_TREOI|nr:hypothetical protein TorRG33x02_067480 [Trema orientale]